ncbi:hypothetical protein Pcinc_043054 [Petrolisthes cinctipes]|uniref:Uncharacterized protein n=1 Tax=Petrolisthes cinctipes TaxID=88211 RepID=A0AAE1EI92_PETCI|nr:hypothetical protein Pcinc_043054 [Petrolisthes cinctipes]
MGGERCISLPYTITYARMCVGVVGGRENANPYTENHAHICEEMGAGRKEKNKERPTNTPESTPKTESMGVIQPGRRQQSHSAFASLATSSRLTW